MKKNLFYLFALICSMSLFTACSDDEDTEWKVYAIPTEFTETKLQVTTNGTEQQNFPVTFTATSANTGTLKFDKIVNVANDFTMDVVLQKTTDGYDVIGEKELKEGYLVSVTGVVTAAKMYLEVKTSGYATVTGSYALGAGTLEGTLNAAPLVAGIFVQPAADFKPTSATAGTLRLSRIITGAGEFQESGAFDGSIDVPVTITVKDEVYSFTGELKDNAKYAASTIKVEGQVGAGKMKLTATHKMSSDVVGDWKVKMATDKMADVVFNFSTKSGKTTFSDAMMAIVASNPAISQIVHKEMPDAQLSAVLKAMLATYVPNLNGIKLTDTGDVTFKFTEMGTTEPTEIAGFVNYIIKDGKFSLVPNLDKLMGMMMSTNTRAYNPNGLLSGDGIPFNFNVKDGALTLSLTQDVPLQLLAVFGEMITGVAEGMVDPDTFKMIGIILGEVTTILSTEGTTLEVGLVMTTK